MIRTAILSEDGKFRYQLTRTWDDRLPMVCWIMLNPSTADDKVDDNTIKKCIGFSTQYGFGKMVVVNLFAFRTKSPKVLKEQLLVSRIGAGNDHYIEKAVSESQTVIAAWGGHGRGLNRVVEVMTNLAIMGAKDKLYYLKQLHGGVPGHPLMLSYNRPLLKMATWPFK